MPPPPMSRGLLLLALCANVCVLCAAHTGVVKESTTTTSTTTVNENPQRENHSERTHNNSEDSITTVDTATTANNSQDSITTTTMTTTTTPHAQECGGVLRCVNDTNCAACLAAINATASFPHTIADFLTLKPSIYRAYQIQFLSALAANASCSTNTTPPHLLRPAMQELGDVASCIDAHGMLFNNCLLAEYACFADHDCGICLAALYDHGTSSTSGATKADVLRSSACNATDPALLVHVASLCDVFPQCTYAKKECANLPDCAPCLTNLTLGNGAESACQCARTEPSGLILDAIVDNCFYSNPVACDYFYARCAQNAHCVKCLDIVQNSGSSVDAIVAAWSSSSCQRATHDAVALGYLHSIVHECTGIGNAQIAITNCIVSFPSTCLACLVNGTVPSEADDYCAIISNYYTCVTRAAAYIPSPSTVKTHCNPPFSTHTCITRRTEQHLYHEHR